MTTERKAALRKRLNELRKDWKGQESCISDLAHFALAKLDQCNECRGNSKYVPCAFCDPELERLEAALIGKE